MPVTRFTPRQILAGLLAGLLAVAAGAHAAAPSKPLQPRPTYQRTPPKPPERAEFAYVEAEAGCVIKGNRLDVTASVAQGPRLGAGPYVWGVTFYIEQRLAGKADGFLEIGTKRLAIINGMEYEAGDRVTPGAFSVKTILPNKVIMTSSQGEIVLPLQETNRMGWL